jgi:hypothetical protein
MSLADIKCNCSLEYRDISNQYDKFWYTHKIKGEYIKILHTDYIKNSCSLCGQRYITRDYIIKGIVRCQKQ